MRSSRMLACVLLLCLVASQTDAAQVPVSETFEYPDLQGPVRVYWDQFHIPHIIGETDTDVMWVQGYVHASKRFAQMDFLRRAATGRLAEILGPSLVSDDEQARSVALHTLAENAYNGMPARGKSELDAYAGGVNAYIAAMQADPSLIPLEYASFGLTGADLDAWTPQDSLAVLSLQSVQPQLSEISDDFNLSARYLRWEAAFGAIGSGGRADLAPELFGFLPAEQVPSATRGFQDLNGVVTRSAPQGPALAAPKLGFTADYAQSIADRFERREELLGIVNGEAGSNSWAVNAALTTNGFPIHANDPHLSLQNPSTFFMNQLNSKDGGGTIHGCGYTLPGTPGLSIGFTENISWGFTFGYNDNLDTYLETVTKDSNGEPGSVLFNGAQVPVERIVETIEVRTGPGASTTQEHIVYRVPHHGYAVNGSWNPDANLIVTFRNPAYEEPPLEYAGLSDALRAQDVFEFREAIRQVINGQAIVAADKDDNILFISRYKLPIRPATALNPQTPPFFPQPGQGSHEWLGYYPLEANIQDVNPTQQFLTTANQDPVGATFDGNPFPTGPDEIYIGDDFDYGYRNARIAELLSNSEGDRAPGELIDIPFMGRVQGDHKSNFGSRMVPLIRQTVANDTSGLANSPEIQLAMRLFDDWETGGWVANTGVEPNATQTQITNSAATALFNTWITEFAPRAYADEHDPIGVGLPSHAITQRFYATKPNDFILWDDLNTSEVETRDQLALESLVAAVGRLETRFGSSNPDDWKWGLMHTLRFRSIFGDPALNIPPGNDPPFPRPGDLFCVDQCGYWSRGENFSYGSGAVIRTIVELTPDGPNAVGVIPGGQDSDPRSPFYTSDVALWVGNQYHPMWFKTRDVVENADDAWVFTPDVNAPVEVELEDGYTFAAFPVEGGMMAQSFYTEAEGQGVAIEALFDYDRFGWRVSLPGLPLNNFALEPCQPFLSFSNGGGVVAIDGDETLSSCDGALNTGWNLVSFPVTASSFSSRTLFESYQDAGCDVFYVASWDGNQWLLWSAMGGDDFPLRRDRSYFIYSINSCSGL